MEALRIMRLGRPRYRYEWGTTAARSTYEGHWDSLKVLLMNGPLSNRDGGLGVQMRLELKKIAGPLGVRHLRRVACADCAEDTAYHRH